MDRIEFESARLRLRRLEAGSRADQDFLLELLNQPSFIHNIADRGVRTLEDAIRYLREGPLASYALHGLGLLAVELKADATPVGLCGLLQRDYLDHPDLGYALLDRHSGRGYAREAAAATLDWAWRTLTPARILAVARPDNEPSLRLLRALGFRLEGQRRLPGHADESCVFVLEALTQQSVHRQT